VVGRWAFTPDLELITATANGERLRRPSSTHTSILGCSPRIRWGKGLAFVVGAVKLQHIAIRLLSMSAQRTSLTLLSL